MFNRCKNHFFHCWHIIATSEFTGEENFCKAKMPQDIWWCCRCGKIKFEYSKVPVGWSMLLK